MNTWTALFIGALVGTRPHALRAKLRESMLRIVNSSASSGGKQAQAKTTKKKNTKWESLGESPSRDASSKKSSSVSFEEKNKTMHPPPPPPPPPPPHSSSSSNSGGTHGGGLGMATEMKPLSSKLTTPAAAASAPAPATVEEPLDLEAIRERWSRRVCLVCLVHTRVLLDSRLN